MTDLFRRDAHIKPRPGTIIAEFTNGPDALEFAQNQRAKGKDYVVTAGINHMFAVRVAIPFDSFGIMALSDRGKAAMPALTKMLEAFERLPHGEGL